MMNNILTFLQQHIAWVLLALFILGWLFSAKIKGNFTGSIIRFITQAEYGKLSKAALADTIEKIQRSDLDDRMVLVMAEAIKSLPVLNVMFALVPRPLFVAWLNNRVQDVFEVIKGTLRGQEYYGPKEENKVVINDETVTDVASDAIVKGIDVLLPKMEATDKTLLEITRTLTKLSNKVDTLQDMIPSGMSNLSNLEDTIKENVIEDAKEMINDKLGIDEIVNIGGRIIKKK